MHPPNNSSNLRERVANFLKASMTTRSDEDENNDSIKSNQTVDDTTTNQSHESINNNNHEGKKRKKLQEEEESETSSSLLNPNTATHDKNLEYPKKRKIQSTSAVSSSSSFPTSQIVEKAQNSSSISAPLTPLQKKLSRIEKQRSLFGSDTKAVLTFKLKELKKRFLTVNDIQNLMLWSLMGHSCTTLQKKDQHDNHETYDALLFTPRWLHIMNMGLIDKVIILHFDSLSKEVFEQYKSHMPNIAKIMDKYVIPDGIPSKRQPYLLINPPWSAEQGNLSMITEKRTANYWRKTFLHRLFKRSISFFKEKNTKKTVTTNNTKHLENTRKSYSFSTMSGTLNVIERISSQSTTVSSSPSHHIPTIEVSSVVTEKEISTKLQDLPKNNPELDNSEVTENGTETPEQDENKTKLEDLLLSSDELSENNYPVFSSEEELTKSGYISTSNWQSAVKKHRLLALDCEMCLTKNGDELTRVTFVDENGQVVYDKLVKPKDPIIDYRTMFSGITKEMLENVQTSLEDVQKEMTEFISHDTILLGHSLENDLICLKICHKRVIDTSVIFLTSSNFGTKYKQSLKQLAMKYLSREIQLNNAEKIGHDSIEDALAALDLVKFVLRYGIEYVHKREKRTKDFYAQENVFEFLSNGEKRSVMLDRANNLNGILSGSLSDAIPCSTDEEVCQKSKKFVSNSEYDLVFSHFSELGYFYEKNEYDPVGAPGNGHEAKNVNKLFQLIQETGNEEETTKHKKLENELLRILGNFDRFYSELFEEASENSLFIVATGHGNISQIERAFKKQKDWKALKENSRELLYLIQNCCGLGFIDIK
ncbi:hypothetical protein FDP41_004950 [Naegleria fowleri]|uniref:Exonuclease domain-containing protein n=1 Tax=Naegleria fowleri TaxID=5763 RepID=A0A6A5BS79_NAEFO|nr:uncharacterized protein FDP41_004950 [Naegleria fowleri]KAF0976275.1 hypothetical protein FDP41_004950 [Naegleria fowleri]